MVDLSEERKRQIRMEEEARSKQLAEERYRQQVRAEIQAGQPAAPAAPPRPPISAPTPAPARGGGVTLYVGLGLLVVGAGLALYAGLVGLSGTAASDPMAGAPEVVAPGGGPLVPVDEGSWPAAELGYDDWVIGPDGRLSARPWDGKAEKKEAAPAPAAAQADRGLLGFDPEAVGERIDTPAGPASYEPLLRYVPPNVEALLVADLSFARRSPALAFLLDVALGRLLEEPGLRELVASGAFDVMGDGEAVVAAQLDSGALVRLVRGRFGADVAAVAAAGAGVVRDDVFLTGTGGGVAAAQQARAGNSVLLDADAGPVVRDGRRGRAGFFLVDMGGAAGQALAAEDPALRDAGWLSITVDASTGGLLIDVRLSLGSEQSAAELAADLAGNLSIGAAMAPSPVARALDKLRTAAEGADLTVRAVLTSEEAQLLLEALPDL